MRSGCQNTGATARLTDVADDRIRYIGYKIRCHTFRALMPRLRPLRLAGYALLALLWLVVMLAPCLAMALAARGELSWQRGPHTADRVWLVMERNQRGLGYSAERIVSDPRPADGLVCARTTVRFFLWSGSATGQNTEYCECYSADGSSTGNCP